MSWREQNLVEGNKTHIINIYEMNNGLFTANLLKKTNTVWFLSIKFSSDSTSHIIYESLLKIKSKEEAKIHTESLMKTINDSLTRYFSNYGVKSRLEYGHLIMPCPICFNHPRKRKIDNEYGLVCEKDGKIHCESIGTTNTLTISRWNFYVSSIVDQILEHERNNLKITKPLKRLIKGKINETTMSNI